MIAPSPQCPFGRDRELSELRARLQTRNSFVLHGDSGVGKTFLIETVSKQRSPLPLYCPDSANGQTVFHHLACALFNAGNPHLRRACGRSGVLRLERSSTLQLRGLVFDALNLGSYWVVLDHLRQPSASLASDIRETIFRGNTPVLAVARSTHMEDLGYIASYFALRSEKMRIAQFDQQQTMEFAQLVAASIGFNAANREEFIDRVVTLSEGLPGRIVALLRMGMMDKYRSQEHVKMTPLYIDFRLAWHAENAR